jgi:hypothetical protein
LSNAQANVITDTGTIQLQNIDYKKSDRRIIVNYSAEDTIRNDHSFFKLDITTKNGLKLNASTSIVSQVGIQNIDIDGNGISVQHNIAHTNEKYFKLVASTFKEGKPGNTNYELFNQSNNEAISCTLPWRNAKKEADSIVVTLYHIQKEYYDYLQSIRNSTSAYRDPFLTPEVIKSNITGGLGIFTYYTFDKRSLTF